MKKLCVMCLTAMMLFAMCLPCGAEKRYLPQEEIPVLQDNQVGRFVRLGILKGTDLGYELERNVTRAEALTFIERTVHPVFSEISCDCLPPSDISGHWAEETILAFYESGYVQGTDLGTYEPNRTVTGKEFVKILLSAMGYQGITLENVFEKAKEVEVLSNNHTSSLVHENYFLRRSDVLKILQDALVGKTTTGKWLHQDLIDRGIYTQQDFEGFLYSGTPAAFTYDFNYKVNQMMPEDTNYMFSPLSIKFAFAMVANGTEGETQKQLLDALKITDLDGFNEHAKALMTQYTSEEDLQLNVANALWINEDVIPERFTATFQETTKKFYNAEASLVNNKTAVPTINQWAEDNTNGKIKDLLPQQYPVEVFLANALYFKGAWQQEFNKGATAKEIFTSRDGSKKEVDFMHRTGYYKYCNGFGTEMIELPYRGTENDISMYLIKGEYKDHTALLKDFNQIGNRTFVTLKMPKFRIENTHSLNDVMKSLGATKMFNMTEAEFDPMIENGNEKFFIRDSLQKTYIDVNEQGTEAAAVTGAAGGGTAAQPPEPIEVTFNDPFTFVIYDNQNHEVLFMGEYAYAE